MESYGPFMAMVFTQVAYGVSNVLIKTSFQRGLNQLVFIIYRHLIGMIILSPIAYVVEREQRPAINVFTMVKIFFFSFIGVTLQLNLLYAGLQYTTPTVVGALSNVIPGLTLVVAVLIRMENVTVSNARDKAKVIGTIICIGGSFIFIFWKGGCVFKGSPGHIPTILIHENWVKGSLFILISDIVWSAWLILQAKMCEIYPAQLSLNALICFSVTLQNSLLALFWGRNLSIWKLGWDVQLWTILYAGGVLSGVVCLQIWCISKKGPVFAAMFCPLLLVIGGILSAIVFGERLHVGSFLGAAVIVIGLYCVLWGKTETTAKQEMDTMNGTQGKDCSQVNKDIDISTKV